MKINLNAVVLISYLVLALSSFGVISNQSAFHWAKISAEVCLGIGGFATWVIYLALKFSKQMKPISADPKKNLGVFYSYLILDVVMSVIICLKNYTELKCVLFFILFFFIAKISVKLAVVKRFKLFKI
jgi:hypothetical protein